MKLQPFLFPIPSPWVVKCSPTQSCVCRDRRKVSTFTKYEEKDIC